jgi:predicted nucleic acid-binding protein
VARKPKVFIDSNIPMYVAGVEHPNRDPARRILASVQAGEIDACSSIEVLQEILYRYSALKKVALAAEIYNLFVALCPVIYSVTIAETDLARDLLGGGNDIGSRDAIHAAVMLNHKIPLIATFDADFDRIPGIARYGIPTNQ